MLKQFFNFLFGAKGDYRVKYNRYTNNFELQKSVKFGYETVEVFEEREEAEQIYIWMLVIVLC